MGNKTAILSLRIIGDATGAVKSMGAVSKQSGAMEKALTGAKIAAGLLLAGLASLARQAGDVASDLEQSAGAVDAVFGSYAGSIHELASSAAQDVGLAKDQYSQVAAVIGSQLKNMGLPMDQVAGQTRDLVTLGADLSAVYGGTAADAVDALSSLLRGERDPIERYGVTIKQANIEAQKASMGLQGLTGDAAKNADLQATLALLMDQTSSATGQFAAQSDTAAESQQIANAAWRDAQGELGTALLPYLSEGARLMSDFAHWVEDNAELVRGLAVALGIGAVAVIALTAAQWAFNIASMANPIGLIIVVVILAIAAIIAIVLLIIKYWKQIEDVAADVWTHVADFVIDASQPIIGFINLIIEAINWLVKLGSGEMFTNGVRSMFGLGDVTYTPQLAKLPQLQHTAPSTKATSTTTNNITVNGAVDSASAAKQIQDLLNKRDRNSGSAPAGGGR